MAQLTANVLKGQDAEVARIAEAVQALTYGTTVTPDCAKGGIMTLAVTDGVGFTIAAPLNPLVGQRLLLKIKNSSGGAMGAVTWNAVFSLAAFNAPANGADVSLEFLYDGTNWVETFKRYVTQATIVALTDNTGLSGTHDDTLAATAALVTLTDSTGDSGTHNDTLADGLTATAPAAITNYTAHAAGAVAVTSNAATDLDTTAAGLATLENEVTALRGTVAACVTDLTVQNQNDSDLCQKIIEVVAQLAVTNQNISDVAQKVLELRTALIGSGVLAAA